MRPVNQRRVVRLLADAGLPAAQIALIGDIPRSTVRGWLAEAKEPKAPSCPRCGHPPHALDSLPEWDYSYLLGFYLGDGMISRSRRGVFRLRIVTDSRYPGIAAECAVAMTAVMPRSRVHVEKLPYNAVEVHAYSKAWPCLFPQHGPGPKHMRRIRLAKWQQGIVARRPEQFIRGLIHSDGCRILNWAHSERYGRYEYPRYFFSQVSDDIRRLFCVALQRLGIEYTLPRWNTVSIARADSVRLLDQFVGPKA